VEARGGEGDDAAEEEGVGRCEEGARAVLVLEQDFALLVLVCWVLLGWCSHIQQWLNSIINGSFDELLHNYFYIATQTKTKGEPTLTW